VIQTVVAGSGDLEPGRPQDVDFVIISGAGPNGSSTATSVTIVPS
jgi:hypothetical protein